MKTRFLLFGEKPFEVFASQSFSDIAACIHRMNDVEVLMYRDTFADLVNKLHQQFMFPELEISFENKVVDLVAKPGYREMRYFAEYSLVVKGDTYFLTLTPYVSGYRPVDLLVDLRGNFLSYEIDTASCTEELDETSKAAVKKEYDRIKRYITTTSEMLNDTIRFYNKEMKDLITHQLANKMRKAERGVKIRESLNFD